MNSKRPMVLSAIVATLSLISCRSGSAPNRILDNSQPFAWPLAINPQFAGADDFSEGLAPVRVGTGHGDQWGYIEKQGKFVINPQFAAAQVSAKGWQQF
jgi:hypothetical protein